MNNTSFIVKITEEFNNLKNDTVLKKHQQIVLEYIKKPMSMGILVQHDLGTGKSLVAAAILADRCDKQVIFISAKSLHGNMIKTIEQYAKARNEEISDKLNYAFVTMNASNMLTQVKRITEGSFTDPFNTASKLNLNDKIIIMDEAHNFFNSITNGSENATGLYMAIMRSNVKVIFLSGTPIINHPFELVPCYNMIARKDVLPTKWEDFNSLFVDLVGKRVKNAAKFQNRIVGLTSYYGSYYNNKKEKSNILDIKDKDYTQHSVKRGDDFPTRLPFIIEIIPMSKYQMTLYSTARELELNESSAGLADAKSMQKPKGIFTTSYKRLSRQVSNFAYPEHAISLVGKRMTLFPDKLIMSDLNDNNMKKYSPKWVAMLKNISIVKGKQLIYSSFVTNAGIDLFAKYISLHGWSKYKLDDNVINKAVYKKMKKYIIISGNIESDDRDKLIEKFNHDSNANGEIISMILISGAGAEGLDLKAIRNIHIMEPYWNWARIEQVVGRGNRYKSHIQLPKTQWTIQVYIYLSDYPTNIIDTNNKLYDTEKTTEILMYNDAKDMYYIIGKFYKVMAEAAIDCAIHNKSNYLTCRLCTPTNEPLYILDITKDMKVRSPCKPLTKEKVKVKEILIDGNPFAWYKNDDVITILEKRDDLGGYIEMPKNHPLYAVIYEKIT